MTITYTQEQEAALKASAELQMAPANSAIAISGSAGTGKSTLLEALPDYFENVRKAIKLLDSKAKTPELVFTGTTHKACQNLSHITGQDVTTIHSTLGLRLKWNASLRKNELVVANAAEILTNKVIVVDEAGYLDSFLLKQLFARTKDCRFILVGDKNQLVPVGMNYSPAFNLDVPKYNLSFVHRQGEGTALQELCRGLANWVEHDTPPNPPKPDNDTIFHVDKDTFLKMVEEDYPTWSSKDYTSKVLAWRNGTVIDYNSHFREQLIGSRTFLPGDYATTNNAVTNRITNIPNNSEVIIDTIKEKIEAEVEGYEVTLKGYPGEYFMPKDFKQIEKKLNQYSDDKNWNGINRVQGYWIDLRAEFACTFNKSQGSTYDTVYIDLDDVGRCNQRETRKRMLYVGASRAKSRVVFTGAIQ